MPGLDQVNGEGLGTSFIFTWSHRCSAGRCAKYGPNGVAGSGVSSLTITRGGVNSRQKNTLKEGGR